MNINPQDLTERENYKLLTGSIIPRPIAFVTSISDDGVVNGAPFSFFNIVSSNPPMISVSVQRKSGVMKDTARNIAANKQFVVHIVNEQNVAKVNETAANLPPDESEIDRAQFTLIDSTKVNVPGVVEAKVRFECELEQMIVLGGTEEQAGCDFIIGRVKHYFIDDAIYNEGKIDALELAAVSRLAGNSYAKIGDLFEIERPE
ncbi:flavin reductase family protein [Solibacillus sp. CAU 1738]|uniref:flavin reductase family protein n=1 Tax=Solibacillus sp. CAU 1738 TaxID=3140363 RepID=UPI003260DA2B